MIIMVSVCGRLSDRWGSRVPTVVGLGTQGLTAIVMYLLQGTAPLWLIAVIQSLYGLGLGFTLAALHHEALLQVQEEQMGSAAGLYSMFRFLGSAIGTAIAGVLLTVF
jgi:MFS family permease